jgi:uncharacterized linocin/CFP29 family protein
MERDFVTMAAEGGIVLHGSVAKKLSAAGFTAHSLRPYIGDDGRSYVTVFQGGKPMALPLQTNATLRYDEWALMDEALLEISRQRLTGVNAMLSRGLTYNIPNGLGKTLLRWEDLSDLNAAEVSMDGMTRATRDRVKYELGSLPLPITHKDFTISARVLEESRNTGESLDVTQLRLSAIKVAEKIEDYFFNGSGGYSFGGGVIYGLANHPNVVTGSLHDAWDDSAATAAGIVADIIAMKQALINVKHYGPYGVFIPTAYETILDEDFKAASDKTLRSRLLEIGNIEFIEVSDFMTADRVAMVELRPETIRIVNALPMTNVEWDEKGGMVHEYKVMAIQVPNVRADQDGNCGVAYYTGS